MLLSKLLGDALGLDPAEFQNADVRSVEYDSRRVEPGSIFVAIPGFHRDGHEFIGRAIKAGAVAVVVREDRIEQLADAEAPAIVPVSDTRAALADLSATLADHPSRKMNVIGVTGTDGKTTTSFLIDAMLRKAGRRTGLVGTVDFRVADRVWPNDTRQTTPEAPELQQLLADMVAQRVEHAIVETSSHALALDRVRSVDFDIAVLTNITSEHLDFHETQEAYYEAKARLFLMVEARDSEGSGATKVLNADDASFESLRELTATATISYGIDEPASLIASDIHSAPGILEFMVALPGDRMDLKLPLTGRFNVSNALAAVAVGLATGLTTDEIKRGLEEFDGIPGRMERIDEGQEFGVIVDYAHTPGSLEKVLRTLRAMTSGRILVTFGSAGERDTQKRAAMGEVAARLADFSVLTNEDPRLEDPDQIVDDIAAGLDGAGRRHERDYLKILDRRRAISAALERAEPGDIVLVAGKGHEQCIIVGDEKLPWDDREVTRDLLRGLARK